MSSHFCVEPALKINIKIFSKVYFCYILNYGYVCEYGYVHMNAWDHQGQRPQIPLAGVISGCELSDMDVGNLTWVNC